MVAVLIVACGSGEASDEKDRFETARKFEEALWSGDLDRALSLVTDDFTYRYPGETISSPEELRQAFGGEEEYLNYFRVESSRFSIELEEVTWESIRYFGDSIGSAVLLTASFDGDLIDSIAEQSSPTTAEDAIGCKGDYPYSWHADYGPDTTGEGSDPVMVTVDAFPQASTEVEFEESNLDAESPMSGGHGPIVRATADNNTVGFVYLTETSDGTFLVDGVTACNGYLEPFAIEEGY